MSMQTISTRPPQKFVGIVSIPRLNNGCDGCPLNSQDLLVVDVETSALLHPGLGLDAPGFRLALGSARSRQGAIQPPLLQVERIPSQTDAVPGDRQQGHDHRHRHQPA